MVDFWIENILGLASDFSKTDSDYNQETEQYPYCPFINIYIIFKKQVHRTVVRVLVWR